MIDRFNQFQWTVAGNGYRITKAHRVEGDSDEEVFLTSSKPFFVEGTLERTYLPHVGLFRTFAELSPKRDQILSFAKRWGMLTAGIWIVEEDKSTTILGEPLDLWTKQIADMSVALRLWELVKAGDSVGLRQFIRWPDQSSVRFGRPDHRGFRVIASRDTNPDLLQTFTFGDLIVPAWHQLQHIINEKLEGNVSARLLWNSSTPRTRLSLYQVPGDLRSALWLQLARGVEGDRKYQQCEVCQNWFEVSSPDGGRKDKRVCGAACRARKWRKRKETKTVKAGRVK
jgi:hypothetical protein